MKKLFTLLALVICLTNLKAQYVTIPDANFVIWLQASVPSAMTGSQMDTTSLAVITYTDMSVASLGINDLTGIQYFDSLKSLNCLGNLFSTLPSLPSRLDTLICSFGNLTVLPSLPTSLIILKCYNNHLNSLPPLPGSLKVIECNSNPITTLPSLPNSLETLIAWGCNLSSLPLLPNSLITLNCNSNSISNLPTLPNSLKEFACGFNLLTSLPALPNALEYLECAHNQLSALPSLPNTITSINCAVNQLTSFSSLPTSLLSLFCEGNLLTSLPILPNSLKLLSCHDNNLTSLPTVFPNSLTQLWSNNNQLTYLPILPNFMIDLAVSNNNIQCFLPFHTILNIYISNNPFTCLPNYIPAMDAGTLNYPLCTTGNINGCPDSYGIVGYNYKDNNANCLKEAGDLGLKNIPLQIYDNANNLLANTYSAINGVYQFQQTANTYTVSVDTVGLPFTSSCTYPGLDSTVTVATLDTNINFALTCKPGFDLGIQSIRTTGIIFPGQTHVLNINAGDITQWYNLNCASGISGTVSFSVNGPVTYIGSAAGSLVPSVAGNVYTYNIADFGTINNTTAFQLAFQTDITAQAGDVICVNATVTPIGGDNNPTNNTDTYCYNVVNSHDPNIKEVYPVDVQPGFNDWLTYTIHFQNTGTAPAFNIRLADTLDAMLDLKTFQIINYSHPNLVDLTGTILNVRFPNIQLPDSTSNSAGSVGFIQYRAKPKATWTAPYKIKNTAYIYFDYNAPIVTNTTYNSILTVTGLNNQKETVMALYPNPTNGTFTIQLNTKEKQLLEVVDMTGNVALSQSIENGKATIEANNLSAGIYNISIKGSNSVVNKKLVIVK